MIAPPTTTRQLVDALQDKLGLTWLAGEGGGDNKLRGEFPEAESQGLVGSLNWVHPFRIQIIGHTEMNSFNAMADSLRKAALGKLAECRPAAMILCDNIDPGETFLDFAVRTNTPLLNSTLADNQLQSNLHYYLASALADRATLHGVFMEVLGIGILLMGDAAVGKSELALELITRGHRLIADDAPEFARIPPDIIRGTCPPLLHDFLEVRGLGLLNIRAMFGDSAIKQKKELHLIVHLKQLGESELRKIDRLRGSFTSRELLGIQVPEVTLPVAPGRELAILVETAVRQYLQQQQGYHAGADFMERQQAAIDKGKKI
jgi:HPr kinase/phosphorylase